ncbi:MAG: MFS transporter [Thermoproteales archaeon]|nr:MFS transporter [Thermoproteales archaeon]
MIAAPIAAASFSLIPLSQTLPLMFLVIVVMNLAMAIHRTPTIALMPDITPSEYLSQANDIINFMGGVGALLAFFLGSILYEKGRPVPFMFVALLLFLGSLILVIVIKEPEIPLSKREEKVLW